MNSLDLLRHLQKHLSKHTKSERTEEQVSVRHNERNRAGEVTIVYLNIYLFSVIAQEGFKMGFKHSTIGFFNI